MALAAVFMLAWPAWASASDEEHELKQELRDLLGTLKPEAGGLESKQMRRAKKKARRVLRVAINASYDSGGESPSHLATVAAAIFQARTTETRREAICSSNRTVGCYVQGAGEELGSRTSGVAGVKILSDGGLRIVMVSKPSQTDRCAPMQIEVTFTRRANRRGWQAKVARTGLQCRVPGT